MSNPFEDADARYRVLVNGEAQYSLWPAAIACPDGWTVVHDADSRSACLEYIEEHWTDMRPASLLHSAHGSPATGKVHARPARRHDGGT